MQRFSDLIGVDNLLGRKCFRDLSLLTKKRKILSIIKLQETIYTLIASGYEKEIKEMISFKDKKNQCNKVFNKLITQTFEKIAYIINCGAFYTF